MQKTLENFFNENQVLNFLEKLGEVSKKCKHVKHIYKMMNELREFGCITSGFSEEKTFDAMTQLEQATSFHKDLSNLKSKALLISLLANDYSKNAKKTERVLFGGLSLFFDNFGKLSTEDFLSQKEMFMNLFEVRQTSVA